MHELIVCYSQVSSERVESRRETRLAANTDSSRVSLNNDGRLVEGIDPIREWTMKALQEDAQYSSPVCLRGECLKSKSLLLFVELVNRIVKK